MPYLRPHALAGALLWAVAIAATLPTPANAQIRRCTTPDGGTLYTDRSCEDLGAIENRPPIEGSTGAATSRYRGGCPRRLQDLVFEVTAAIDARDANRLARSYHWVGMSHRSGYAVIERLDRIAGRPLLNISALRPAQAVVAPAEPASAAITDHTTVPAATAAPATPPRSRRPVALRIDQVLSDGITPSSTTFGLRRHMDCWWITL